MMESLSSEDRLRLLGFVCSFAWADLEVAPEERAFVEELVRRWALTPEERRQVEQWLQVPPRPEDVDPFTIPAEHRRLLLDATFGMVTADGKVTESEVETYRLFATLLGSLEEEDERAEE